MKNYKFSLAGIQERPISLCMRECWNILDPNQFPKLDQTFEFILESPLVGLRAFQYLFIVKILAQKQYLQEICLIISL